ncbi:MAG: pitrilysin family protein [Chloroflexota bacterium]
MTQSDLITTLDNGLRVVLRSVHAAPVISLWVGYKIGSRNEQTGQTGISHWVEHMLFKGTDKFPMGALDREIDRAGGQWNAFTSMDYTMYYATMPADRIGIALEAEADRMANALFDPEETESERTVVISERQGSENDPMFWLSEEMQAVAFRVHGYHHTIIGDSTDLETMTRDELYAHYQRYYTPSNAVIVAVGAFDSAEMLADIKTHFEHLENTPQPTAFVRPEPPQQGERRVTVERPGMTSFLSMAHRVPACTKRDWFAMEVLNSVLTGSGGSIDNKTARLYKTLVKSGIAASIDGDLSESIDPYLYEITVTLNDGYTHAEAEAVILAEIDHMQTHGITEAELNKAKKQAKASFAYSSESVTNQAYWLAHSHIINDPQWYDDFLERLGAVTIEDVQRVAQTYLNARNRVTGWLVPIMLDEDEDDYDDMYDEADEAEAEVAQ